MNATITTETTTSTNGTFEYEVQTVAISIGCVTRNVEIRRVVKIDGKEFRNGSMGCEWQIKTATVLGRYRTGKMFHKFLPFVKQQENGQWSVFSGGRMSNRTSELSPVRWAD